MKNARRARENLMFLVGFQINKQQLSHLLLLKYQKISQNIKISQILWISVGWLTVNHLFSAKNQNLDMGVPPINRSRLTHHVNTFSFWIRFTWIENKWLTVIKKTQNINISQILWNFCWITHSQPHVLYEKSKSGRGSSTNQQISINWSC